MPYSVGSASVDLVPSAKGFQAKTDALLRDIKAKVDLVLDDAGVRRQIDQISRGTTATVNAKLDDTAAKARLDALTKSRSATVNVNADTGSAETKIAALGSSAGGASSRVSALAAAGVALAPAIVPAAAAASAALLGIGAGAIAGSAGIGVLVIGLSGVFTAVTASGKKAKEALAQLTPEGRALAIFLKGTLLPGFKALSKIAQGPIAAGILTALQAMRPLVPVITGMVSDLAGALGDMIAAAGKSLGSPFWVAFFKLIRSIGVPVIDTLGKIIGNLATGFAGMLTKFEPVGKAIGDALLRMSQSFAAFGTGKTNGLQTFFDYVMKIGPQVSDTFGSLFRAAGHLIVALAPLGSTILGYIKTFADAISKLPADVLAKVAGAVVGIVLAIKGLSIGSAIFGALGTAAAILAEPVGLVAVALGAIVAGVTLVLLHSKPFRDFLAKELIPALKEAADWIGVRLHTALSAIWQLIQTYVVPTLIKLGRDALAGARAGFHAVTQAIQDNRPELEKIWEAFKKVYAFVYTKIVPLLGPILKVAFEALGRYIATAIRVIGGIIDVFTKVHDAAVSLLGPNGTLRKIFSSGVTALGKIWDGLKALAKAPIKFIVQTVLENGILAAFRSISKFLGFDSGANLHVSLPKGFYNGGQVLPGDSNWQDGDSLLVKARPGEGFVMSEVLRDPYERARFHEINRRAKAGQSFRDLQGFAGGGIVSNPRGHVHWKGGEFTRLFLSRLLQAQSLAHVSFNVFQGGFRPATSYSGTSHAGDAADLGPVLASVVRALRQVGLAAWRRGPAQGFAQRHIHVVPTVGNGFAGGSGLWQAKNYLAGGDGLGGKDYEARGGSISGGVDTSGFFAKVKSALAGMAKLGSSPFVRMIEGIPNKIASSLKSKVTDLASKFVLGTANPGTGFGTKGTNRERGRSLMRQIGFADNQWPALDKLWTRESNWNERATNPSSGAYGIPQALPGSKMASVAPDWRGNPNTQIMWGLKYIKDRYGSPSAAWAHELSAGWYDQGGWLQPGTTIVHNATGKPEPVLNPAQWDSVERLSRSNGRSLTVNGNVYGDDFAEQIFDEWDRRDRRAAVRHNITTAG